MGITALIFFHLGRYIVSSTIGNYVLWRRDRVAVKRNFRQ